MRYKYCDDDDYMHDTYQALSSQFANRLKFESFYALLKDRGAKDEFLRAGSAYLFFVKNGDWYVDVERSNRLIEYFTNSFKLVALLAIIESLAEKKNIDFFFWLLGTAADRKELFPIANRPQLKNLYDEYKSEYGSTRSCKSFFANLSSSTKEKLCNSITINGKPVKSIEKFVAMLYTSRSGFAHECATSSEISNGVYIFRENNKEIVWKLPMRLLQRSFEEGIVAHFKQYTD